MSGVSAKPHALRGEVWRGSIDGELYAVALQGAVTVWRWSLTCWVTPVDKGPAICAWALHEHERAEHVTKVAALERLSAMAWAEFADALHKNDTSRLKTAGDMVADVRAKLRALGIEP